MNKSLLTNLVAATIFLASYFAPEFTYRPQIVQASLFALSGALTNWLAVHMLFEKVPGLYGSGIIVDRFMEFKVGIRSLIVDNFFTNEDFAKYIENNKAQTIDTQQISEDLFYRILTAIKDSTLGPMLNMFGGEQVLLPMKEKFIEKISPMLEELKEKFLGADGIDALKKQLQTLVDQKLEDLTPEMVKEIIQNMIRKHLGWLVVWGGVFGAIIGLLCSFL